jgi:prepilin-type N-terminal cleavage/methylation domain-containing protein
MNNPLQQHATISTAHQQGFTLLEMILVVFIMGTLATISMSFIESEDSQWRYDESLRKMAMVRDAVLKVRDYKSQQIMSGFVFDNGKLPDNTGPFDQLIGSGSLQTFEEKKPYYLYNSGNSSVRLSDVANNNDIELTLFKGYRAGAYLASGLDSNNDLLDAWGTNFLVTTPSTPPSYSVKLALHTAPYNNQPGFSLTEHDWAISVSELNIQGININNTGLVALTDDITIALFIYQNSSLTGVGEWVIYKSDEIKSNIPTGVSTYLLTKKAANGVPEKMITSTDRIPAGTHLLTIISSNKMATTPTDGDISYPIDKPAFQKFTLFPGSSLPDLTLMIK